MYWFLDGQCCCWHSNGCSGGLSNTSCLACPGGQCPQAEAYIIEDHEIGETRILASMRADFHEHRQWIMDRFLPELIPAYMLMTEQMSNVAMYQMYLVGKLFDSKLHLEGQRLFNELQNEAAKDYYPSDSFCWFGTNARSLSNSEALSHAHQGALTKADLDRQLGILNSAASDTQIQQDMRGRWVQFLSDYCDPHDNDYTGGTTGLVDACGGGSANPDRTNIDIDFQRLVEEPRYLNLDFVDGTLSEDEEDVMALSRNLYGHKPIAMSLTAIGQESVQHNYMRLRSVAAKRSVAQNSYNAIVGMKGRGSGGGGSAQYLKAIMADLGMDNAAVEEILGENPSYYAQLEALGKKIFQNTDFFTDLYDKPANVKRKQAAMNAIELMLDRAIFESELRHEIILSVLLSSYLEEDKERIFLEFENAGNE
ncbi:MAG: hypothetical protein ACLFR0_08295 [Alphaproteobacteria bacterium]